MAVVALVAVVVQLVVGNRGKWTMKKSHQCVNAEEKKAIEQAVADAEKKTSGEIVPVIATQSGDYLHANYMIGFCFSILVTVAVWFSLPRLSLVFAGWSSQASLGTQLILLVVIQIISFLFGTWFAKLIPSLKLFFLCKQEMAQNVERKAAEAFYKFGVRHTQGATGVVIYVSLYEHMVRVEGDSSIAEKVDASAWQDICSTIISSIKAGQLSQGMMRGIEKSGDLLAGPFPIQPDDTNELPNKLNLL